MAAAPPPASQPIQLQSAWSALKAGQLDHARALCDAVLSGAPKHPDALLLRGMLHQKAGEPQHAERAIERAIAAQPHFPFAFYTLGLLRLESDQPAAAATAFRRAVELEPSFAPAWATLAAALRAAGKPRDALDACERALALQPDAPVSLCIKADLLGDLGRFDEAIACARQTVARAPAYPRAWRTLAHLLECVVDHPGALAAAEQWRALEPGSAAAAAALARLYSGVERHDDAVAVLEAAVARSPDDADLQTALGFVKLAGLGLVAAGIAHARHAATLRPTALHASTPLFYQHYAAGLSAEALQEEQAAWQRRYEASATPAPLPARARDPERKLRVGFVSSDLHHHPVTRLLAPLLGALDRSRFELAAYYVGNARRDALTADIERAVDLWRAIDATPAAASAILDDRIDILVDLAGHTRGNLLEIFARKCAPIQVSWLGYPDMTGLSRIDYRLTDAIVDPPVEPDRSSSERPIRLPNGFHCYVPYKPAPPPGPLPARRNGFITFGSMNSLAKISDDTVAGWAAILRDLPQARLLIRRGELAAARARDGLLERFAAHGIGADRLMLVVGDAQGDLAVYQQIDIALDTFPYNGRTTTCEALWMGVPVVTWRGDRRAGRVGASLLAPLGLDALVGRSVDEFGAIATALAGDPTRLETLRASLRDRMTASPLCDLPGFAREIEAAFRFMWTERCRAPA